MTILGYIVTSKKMNNIEGFVEQIGNISEADSTKPILIIGWNNAKQFEGYNILNRKISEGVFWTFSKSENRYEFEKDLKKFYEYIIDNITKNTIYTYVNIYKLKYNKIKKLYNIYNSNIIKNIYISNSMIYTAYNGSILGVSLSMLEYCGIKREKVLERLKKNVNNRLIYDTSKDSIKIGRLLGNKKYAMLCFI
jgi:hypothetical protein